MTTILSVDANGKVILHVPLTLQDILRISDLIREYALAQTLGPAVETNNVLEKAANQED